MILSGKARLAGVVGWPITHSLSPRLHGFWLERYQLDGAYVPLAVPPGRFDDAIGVLATIGFAGVNVTIPHKERALERADVVDQSAQRIGAANTLVFASDGSVRASNTDAFGFLENLRASVPDMRLKGITALVIGAGGASRAIVASLVGESASEVRITNRTDDRARALVRQFGPTCVSVPWNERESAVAGADLVINTTALGMMGNPPLELDLSAMASGGIVADVVYSPARTPLLTAAADRGLQIVEGLGMLLHQARPGFEAWFGIVPTVTAELEQFVRAGLGQ